MPKPKPAYRYRSAATGRYVKACYALRYPHLTVRETVKPRCGTGGAR
jgi:hypothetical protein